MHTDRQTDMHACMHTYIYTYTRLYIHTSVYTYIHPSIHTYTLLYIHTPVYTYIRPSIHTYTRLHTTMERNHTQIELRRHKPGSHNEKTPRRKLKSNNPSKSQEPQPSTVDVSVTVPAGWRCGMQLPAAWQQLTCHAAVLSPCFCHWCPCFCLRSPMQDTCTMLMHLGFISACFLLFFPQTVWPRWRGSYGEG